MTRLIGMTRQTGMTRQIVKIAIGMTVVLSSLAVPGYADSIIQLTTSIAGGTVTLNGAADPNNSISAISNVLFNEFSINFGLNVAITQTGVGDGLQMTGTIANPVWTLFGGIPSLGLADGTDLLQIGLASAVTNLPGSTSLNASIPSDTALLSVTGNQTFLDDILGLAVGTPAGVTGLILGGSGFLGGAWSAGVPDTVNSEQITLDLTKTPEPTSFCLAGVGLLLAGLLARRKSIKEA